MFNKRAVLAFLLGAPRVSVVVDVQIPGVVLPEQLMTAPDRIVDLIVLGIDNQRANYRDLKLDEDALRVALSFEGVPQDVVVPWAAIQSLFVGEHAQFHWPEGVGEGAVVKPAIQEAEQPRGHLRSV